MKITPGNLAVIDGVVETGGLRELNISQRTYAFQTKILVGKESDDKSNKNVLRQDIADKPRKRFPFTRNILEKTAEILVWESVRML